MDASSQPVSRAMSPTNNRSSSNLPNFGGSQPVDQGVNNMQKNFQNMYKDLNQKFSTNGSSQMKVNSNGTISLGAQDRMTLPRIPNFNAGEYLSKAI